MSTKSQQIVCNQLKSFVFESHVIVNIFLFIAFIKYLIGRKNIFGRETVQSNLISYKTMTFVIQQLVNMLQTVYSKWAQFFAGNTLYGNCYLNDFV